MRDQVVRERNRVVLDEYCLSAVGKSAAMAYLRRLGDDDMERARGWWLRKLNGGRGPPMHDRQRGCPEILAGLRATPVWPRLDWFDDLEARVPELTTELLSLRGQSGFQPYRSPDGNGGMAPATDAGAWNVFYVELHNVDLTDNRQRCPVTCDVLDSVPRAYGHAFFSAAAPKTHITTHHGPTNKKLRCYLPLVCPPNKCRLRVGDDVVDLVQGTAVLFDDSFDHEAWNDADEPRIVLIFDVWHPDLSPREVKFLSFLQTAAMHRDKRLCGKDGDNFFAVIDKARDLAPDDTAIWGSSACTHVEESSTQRYR